MFSTMAMARFPSLCPWPPYPLGHMFGFSRLLDPLFGSRCGWLDRFWTLNAKWCPNWLERLVQVTKHSQIHLGTYSFEFIWLSLLFVLVVGAHALSRDLSSLYHICDTWFAHSCGTEHCFLLSDTKFVSNTSSLSVNTRSLIVKERTALPHHVQQLAKPSRFPHLILCRSPLLC